MTRRPNVPVTQGLRARVIDLHERGIGRNDIARLTGTSTATVSRIVREAGGTFDTAQTKAATQIRQATLQERRARLAERLTDKAAQILDDMDEPFLAFNFGGKDNTYEEHELERAPAEAVYTMMRSASLALQRSMDLVKFDQDPNDGLSAVDEWLATMMPPPSVTEGSEIPGLKPEPGNAP